LSSDSSAALRRGSNPADSSVRAHGGARLSASSVGRSARLSAAGVPAASWESNAAPRRSLGAAGSSAPSVGSSLASNCSCSSHAPPGLCAPPDAGAAPPRPMHSGGTSAAAAPGAPPRRSPWSSSSSKLASSGGGAAAVPSGEEEQCSSAPAVRRSSSSASATGSRGSRAPPPAVS
jgi:hypothetical protein